MDKLTIILGSSSVTRQELFARLGLAFRISSPDIDETPLTEESAAALVKRLAIAKAEKIALEYHEHLIITADTVGSCDNMLLNKPLTHENAVAQLTLCSNKKVNFYTGLCLLNSKTNHLQVCVEGYDVYFRSLSKTLIENYLHKEQAYHCSGSIKGEGLSSILIEKMLGDDFSALLGLPLIRLTRFLQNEGVDFFCNSSRGGKFKAKKSH